LKLVVRNPPPWLLQYGFWHLLVDGDARYLYVNCEQSAAGYSIMVQLTSEECVEYHALGWTFLQYMAEKINHFPSTYVNRRVSKELQEAAEAIIAVAKLSETK
jgi:hypothetical protein